MTTHRPAPTRRHAIRHAAHRLLTLGATAATLTALWTGTAAHAQPAAPAPVRAVATFSILGDVVRQVGGERIQLSVLVGPGGDAHVFQPKPTDAKTVGQAQVIFAIGMGFEGWMHRLLKTAKADHAAVVPVSQGVTPLKRPAKPQGREHAHHHHGEHDPHIWQSVPNMQIVARNVAQGLCKADPAGCDGYRQRAEGYSAQLQQLHTDIQAAWSAIAPEQRKVITQHNAFAYYAQTYGVQFLSPQGVSTESEASAKAVAGLIQQIRRENVRALFLESISDPRLIEQIASETGLRPAGTLYSDSLSPAGGPAETYIQLMRHNTQVLTQAIQSAAKP